MKQLILMRGLPGSGKSTIARILADSFKAEGAYVQIRSTDDFFVDEDGIYRFNPRLLEDAHSSNIHLVEGDMKNNEDVIIVDNTHVRFKHMEPYALLAQKYGYEIQSVMVGFLNNAQKYFDRCVHSVPLETIERMAREFEV
jgi:predicted kinase